MMSRTEDVGRGIQDTDEGISVPFHWKQEERETVDSSGFVGSVAGAGVNSYVWL